MDARTRAAIAALHQLQRQALAVLVRRVVADVEGRRDIEHLIERHDAILAELGDGPVGRGTRDTAAPARRSKDL